MLLLVSPYAGINFFKEKKNPMEMELPVIKCGGRAREGPCRVCSAQGWNVCTGIDWISAPSGESIYNSYYEYH